MIQIKVKPNSRKSLLEEQNDKTWIAHLKSQPIDGKANEELIALVAAHFKCKKSAVNIKSGAGSRLKKIIIDGE